MPENLLALDCGTQSVRALVFDPRGNLLAKQRIPIEPYYSTAPGLAEQDPEVFWQALCDACQGLWTHGADASSIAAVALTTQRGTVINLDKQGKPLRPAIIWLDKRRTEGLPPVGGLWGIAFKLIGASSTVAYLQAEAEANWIRTHQPDIWNATIIAVYLLVCDLYRQLFPHGVRERGFPPELTDEEALTIGIVGEYLGLPTDKAIYRYFRRHYQAWFPHLKDRTLLVRQWANLWVVEQHLWQALLRQAGALNEPHQVIDTIPVPICAQKRAARRQIFQGDTLLEPDYGYCEAKDWHYFGFKGLCASRGMALSSKPVWFRRGRTTVQVWTFCSKCQRVPRSMATKPLWIGNVRRRWSVRRGFAYGRPVRSIWHLRALIWMPRDNAFGV